MNSDTLQGQCRHLKGKVQEQWGDLSDDDVDRVSGSYDQLIGRTQERYGVTTGEARSMVDGRNI